MYAHALERGIIKSKNLGHLTCVHDNFIINRAATVLTYSVVGISIRCMGPFQESEMEFPCDYIT